VKVRKITIRFASVGRLHVLYDEIASTRFDVHQIISPGTKARLQSAIVSDRSAEGDTADVVASAKLQACIKVTTPSSLYGRSLLEIGVFRWLT
jgi:hypothetical protein